jgi:hypothetical protein
MCQTMIRALTLGSLFVLLPAADSLAAEPSGKEIYQRTLRATCWVVTRQGAGTGWLVDCNRKEILTNSHVVGDNSTVSIVFPAYADGKVIAERSHYQKRGRAVHGKVLSRDPDRDLALIEVASVPAECVALKLAGESMRPGDRVHTVGNPGASEALWVYTAGMVRTEVFRGKLKLTRPDKPDLPLPPLDAYVFETQSPINPGDSGGPVVNDQGELVGVNCGMRPGAQQVTFCIDVREVKAFLASGPGPSRRSPEPSSSEALKLRDRGSALLRQGEYQAAVDSLTRALDLNPKDYQAYNERGAAYTWLDKDNEAVRDFSQAVALNDRYSVAYRNRGAAYLRLGKLDEAVRDFSRAIELNDRYARAYLGRSDAYARLGKRKEAQADHRKALELDPSLKK